MTRRLIGLLITLTLGLLVALLSAHAQPPTKIPESIPLIWFWVL
jgi:hypothetical protein